MSMNREEAINRIENHMEVHGIGEYPHIALKEALDMADMLLSYSIKARESKSKKELKKVIYELKEEMDLKKYDVTEMEMLEGMK